MDDKMLSTGDCAARLGISRQAITDAVRRGDIPAIKIGKTYVVKLEDCDAYTPKLTPSERGKAGMKSRWSGKKREGEEVNIKND